MKAELIGEPRVAMSNPTGKHNYFAWPTVARLDGDRIGLTASGYRIAHVCPFGKAVMSISVDEGKTFSVPAPVIDTVLDDRDSGILCFGKEVIVTSFNSSLRFMREEAGSDWYGTAYGYSQEERDKLTAYKEAFLDLISPEEAERDFGSVFRWSHDGGVTFSPIYESPVTSPHGPCVCRDGAVLWVGNRFLKEEDNIGQIECHRLFPDGTTAYVGTVPCPHPRDYCEPHCIEVAPHRLVCLMRRENNGYFAVYQSVSLDDGKTWSEVRQINGDFDGAPPHILQAKDGTLIATYGWRAAPFGIRAMVSRDLGETWEINLPLYDNGGVSADLGYPSTVELKDGSFLTAFYAHPTGKSPAVILSQQWRLTE